MKKILMILPLFIAVSAYTQIYDFTGETVGNMPANVSLGTNSEPETNDGTIVVAEYNSNNTMECTSIGSTNVGIFDMDLFTSESDYSITWKETYTTARRSGFLLRANGACTNTNYLGMKNGYLFQVNSTANNLRIYSMNGTAVTQLSSAGLTAPGVNTPRWYRATVDGTQLTFEYSDDGSTWNTHTNITNSTFSSGSVQYTIGYGAGAGGMFIDDIGFNSIGTSTEYVVVNNIDDYQIFQRDGSNQADIPIIGSYGGTPTAIEASFNGGAYVTIDASPSGGTYSGTLSAQATGQGTIIVRFTNDTDVSYDVDNVGIGDIFIIAGQSNASGRGWTLNNYSHASLKGALFGNDDNWKELADAVDSNTGQIDPVSSDAAAAGSPWPLVASNIMAAENVPVAFVPTAMGGTSILAWQPGANHSDPSTLYGSMNRRITAAGGNARAILFFQGERDAKDGTTQATYEARMNTLVNTANSDFPGLQTMIGQIGQSGSAYPGKNEVRAGQINVSHTNANAILGPVTYDINLDDEGGDNVHFKSDSDMAAFVERWYKAIDKAFYGGTNGYGPIVDNLLLDYNGGADKVIAYFNDDTSPVIDPTSTVATTSFELKNNGIAVSISSVNIVGNTVEITPASPLNTSQSLTLTYASLNTGVDAAIYDDDGLPAENFYNITIDCSVIVSYPYTETFDSWTTSSPTTTCTSDGSVPLGDCWTNVTGDDIDWDVHSGSTGSIGTGPTSDHTGGGNYFYTEASNCLSNTGSITSPAFNLSGITDPELTFWYHMWGIDMGTLSIQVSTDGGSSWSSDIWSLSGDQGNSWQEAIIDLNAYTSETDLVIRFIGLTGSDYTSDMAIDDFSITGVPGVTTQDQLTDLAAGWNITSFFVTPSSVNMIDLFQPLIDNSTLVKISDEAGGIVQYIPGPGWLNTIGNMSNTEGYYVNLSTAGSITTNGNIVTYPFDIQLYAGWNIMSYPCDVSQVAITILQPLIDAGYLVKVLSESGGIIQDIPGVGWINTIVNFIPGEGYYINVNTDCTLTHSDPSKSTPTLSYPAPELPTNFFAWHATNPFSPMNIVVRDLSTDGFKVEEGDEIAVYDGDLQVGSAVIVLDEKGYDGIIARTDDPTTEMTDGFTKGNEISFKLWDRSEDLVYSNIEVTHLYGDQKFNPLGTLNCDLKVSSLGGTEFGLLGATFLGQNFPNPYSDKSRIDYGIAEDAYVNISVHDVSGRTVMILKNSNMPSGKYYIEMNKASLEAGLYYYTMKVNGRNTKFSETRKMILY